MADENTTTDAKTLTAAFLKTLAADMVGIITDRFPEVARKLKDNFDGPITDSAKYMEDSFSKATDNISQKFEEQMGKSSTGVGQIFVDTITKNLSGILNIGSLFSKDKSEFSNLIGSMLEGAKEMVSKHPIDMGAYLGLNTLADKISANKIFRPILDFEKQITEQTGPMATSLVGLTGAFSDLGDGTTQFSTNIGGAIERAGKSITELGTPARATTQNLQSLIRAGIDLGSIGNISLAISGENDIRGLSAAMLIAKATGQDFNTVAEQIRKQIKELGYEGNQVADVFAAIKSAQEGTRLSFTDVQSSLISGAEHFRFYGTKIEGLTGIFKSLNATLGEGREGLTGELFKDVIQGLGDLDFSRKAFVASQTDLGQGRDVIGGGLAYEQAVSEGKFDKLLDSFEETIKKNTGGGQILTREEALETGKSQEFLIQRQLAKDFLNISESSYNDFAKLLQSDRTRAAEVIGRPEDLGMKQQQLAQLGKTEISAEEGVFGAQTNRLRGEALQSMAKFSTDFITNSESISNATVKFINAIENAVSIEKQKPSLTSIGQEEYETGPVVDVGLQNSVAGQVGSGLKSIGAMETAFDRVKNDLRSTEQLNTDAAAFDAGLTPNTIAPQGRGRIDIPEVKLGTGLQLRPPELFSQEEHRDMLTPPKNIFNMNDAIASNSNTSVKTGPTAQVETREAMVKAAADFVASLTLNVKINNDGTMSFVQANDLIKLEQKMKTDITENSLASTR